MSNVDVIVKNIERGLRQPNGEQERQSLEYDRLVARLDEAATEERQLPSNADLDALHGVLPALQEQLNVHLEFIASERLRQLASERGRDELANENELRKEIGRRERQLRLTRELVARAISRNQAKRPRARRHSLNAAGVVVFERTAQPAFTPPGQAHGNGGNGGAKVIGANGANGNAKPNGNGHAHAHAAHLEESELEHHDVLVVPPKGVHRTQDYYRFPVNKTQGQGSHELPGTYTAEPELMDAHDFSTRRVFAVARPQDWGPAALRGKARGPALATLPVKPEPAATSTCVSYLINTQNINYRNCWTAEEWNDVPGGPDLPAVPGVYADEVEALLGGPQGKVFHIKLKNVGAWAAGTNVALTLKADDGHTLDGGFVASVRLKHQTEVWNQLRNGTVIGRALFDDEGSKRVVPLVNITSLTPLA